MTLQRSYIFAILLALVLSTFQSFASAAPIQDDKGADKVKPKPKDTEEPAPPELLTPNLMHSKYGFGVYVPDGYTSTVSIEKNIWAADIASEIGDPTQPAARLTIEKLPPKATDVGEFWTAMKERDDVMKHNITYERITKVAGSGAIQARIEKLEGGQYVLAILWVWTHDGYGFTLTGYPPKDGDASLSRDLAKELIDQFRWMTKEEIEAAKNAPPAVPEEKPKTKLPPGKAF
jgi:hypothetical protein